MWTGDGRAGGKTAMLSDLERQEIEAELQHYEQKRSACITALKIVQRHKG